MFDPGSGGGAQAVEARFEVADQVLHVFQAGVEADQSLFLLPAGGRALRGGQPRKHQALVATPGSSECEQLVVVDHGRHGLERDILEHDTEQSRRSVEVALPELVPGTGGQRRMEHTQDLGAVEEEAHAFFYDQKYADFDQTDIVAA